MGWKKITVCILAVVFLLFSTAGTALAFFGSNDSDPEDHMTEPNIEEQGGVELQVKRYPVSRYMANNEDADGMIKGAFVGMNNVIFSVSGYIVLVVDTAMDVLYSLQPIDEFSDTLTSISTTIYDTLKEHFGQMLFIFACGYILYLTMVQGTIKEAMRRSFLFLMVLIFGGYWMLNAGFFMQSLNALSVEAQGYLLDAGNGLVNMADGEGIYADTELIDDDNKLEGTIAVMRNVYFDLALKRPYLLVNYGETNDEAVNDHDPGEGVPGGDDYNRVDRLLAFDLTNDGQEHRLRAVRDEVEDYNNENMGGGNVFSQFGQALISFVGSLFLGIPFLLLSLFNFLLQLVALALAFFIPFAFILSYIPQFAQSGFVALGKLLSVFVIKAMLGILILFVYVLTFIVDAMLPPDSLGMYLLNLVVLIGVLIFMIWKRDSIVKLMTAGRVQSLDGNMMNNVKNSMVNPAMNAAKSGIGMVNPALYAAMNKVGGLRESASAEGQNAPQGRNSENDHEKEQRTSQTGNHEAPKGADTSNKKTIERTPQAKREHENGKEGKEKERKISRGDDDDFKPVSKRKEEHSPSKDETNIHPVRHSESVSGNEAKEQNSHLQLVEKEEASSSIHEGEKRNRGVERTRQGDGGKGSDLEPSVRSEYKQGYGDDNRGSRVERSQLKNHSSNDQSSEKVKSVETRSHQKLNDVERKTEKEIQSIDKDKNRHA